MKLNPLPLAFVCCATLLTPAGVAAAESKKTGAKAADPVTELFGDDVLCRGKGVEIKRSQVDAAYVLLKTEMAARGRALPETKRAEAETQLLDRLIVAKLLVSRATEEDRAQARTMAEKISLESRQRSGSEESFERQLQAFGLTAGQFEAQILEKAVCEKVVDRELKSKIAISGEQAKKFYDANTQEFERPEMLRAAHILISTRDIGTGRELTENQKKEKRQLAERIQERARKGEDFAALAREFSDDPGSKDKGGEYTFPRGQMVPEFENAAWALKTNQVSDLVTTQFGFHVIKVYERLPARTLAFEKMEMDLKEYLTRQEVEKQLPTFVGRLKKEAELEYLNGAKPPPERAPAESDEASRSRSDFKPATP